MDDDLREKMAKVEVTLEFIKDLMLEQKDMLAKHVEADGDNFKELKLQLAVQEQFITKLKIGWHTLAAVGLVIATLGQVIWHVGTFVVNFITGT